MSVPNKELKTLDHQLLSCVLFKSHIFLSLFLLVLFFQISVVTSINHYNPGLYLHLSLHWCRIPVLCFQFLLVLVVIGLLEFLGGFNGVCMLEETKQTIVRPVFPLMILNLLLQLGVVVDSYWGWRRVWRVMVTLCGTTNTVHPGSGVELGHLQQHGVGPQQHQSGEESPMLICNIPMPKVTHF